MATKPKLPQCKTDPYAEVIRKRIRGIDHAFCKECTGFLGLFCMSEMNGDLCQFLRHTTAEHTAPTGISWVDTDLNNAEVDTDLNNAEVEVALGDDEVETELVDTE